MKMKRNRQICIATIVGIFIIGSLTGCLSKIEKKGNTPEDYRDKIVEAGAIDSLDSTELSDVYSAYDQLRAMGELSEEDYENMMEIASLLDEKKLQYELLVESYRLYPTKQKANQMENHITLLDEENIAILDDFYKQIGVQREEYPTIYKALKELVFSSAWTDLFQFEEGLLNKNTLVQREDKVWQIRHSKLRCDVLYYDNHSFFYFSILENGNGHVFGGDFSKNKVDGKFTFCRFQDEDTCHLVVEGTMKDTILVDEFSIKVNDDTFTGTLDKTGHVTTAQNKRVSHLIYAYDSTNKKYLSVEDASLSEFVMDSQFWKLPQIDVWELD